MGSKVELKEKIAILGAKEREWFPELEPYREAVDTSGEKRWSISTRFALKLRIQPEDDDIRVIAAKERVVLAIAKSMFIRAVLAGYDYGLIPEVREEILKNKELYLAALGVTIKREGELTGELPEK